MTAKTPRYLTLSADFRDLSLVDPYDAEADVADLLPKALRDRLVTWNETYRRVIPLGTIERQEPDVQALVTRLDEEGLVLVRRIEVEAFPGAKVGYFSEGLGRRLPTYELDG